MVDFSKVSSTITVDITKLKLPINGWAPGGYMGKCRCCGETSYDVDKRSIHCFECAVNGLIDSNVSHSVEIGELKGKILELETTIKVLTGMMRKENEEQVS